MLRVFLWFGMNSMIVRFVKNNPYIQHVVFYLDIYQYIVIKIKYEDDCCWPLVIII